MPGPGYPLNCPKCGHRLTYVRTVGENHFYDCPRHGPVMLPPSGIAVAVHLDHEVLQQIDAARQEVLVRVRELRERYRDAHKQGMDALNRRDFKALSEAIDIETKILEEQRQLIAEVMRQVAILRGDFLVESRPSDEFGWG